MAKEEFNFYDKTNLNSYNLNESMRYQLNMLDSLDVFTRKHSENVASLACRICEYLKLNKDFTVYCTMCAYLHDVGKQFVPAEILQKNGPLTPEEYETMKTHVTIGHRICMADLKLRPYAAGPIYHHESLNGTGYPYGLTQKEIPFEGQIIRVADEYDAIVNKRQYKSHVGISDTLKILVENTKPNSRPDMEYIPDKKAKIDKLGKINPLIVRTLFKVVIDDVEFEITSKIDYVEFIKENIKRLEQIKSYNDKMDKAKTEKDKQYYLEGMKMFYKDYETLETYEDVLKQYKQALKIREDEIDNLYKEIKVIKKLKV